MVARMKITHVLAAASAVGVLAFTGGPAMAEKGSCNPAPDPYHVKQMAKANGTVFVEVGYGWDGVSVFPNCAGPLVGARVTSSAETSWYARFPKARGGFRSIEVAPGSSRTYSAAQLAAVGLDTLAEIDEVVLRPTPNG